MIKVLYLIVTICNKQKNIFFMTLCFCFSSLGSDWDWSFLNLIEEAHWWFQLFLENFVNYNWKGLRKLVVALLLQGISSFLMAQSLVTGRIFCHLAKNPIQLQSFLALATRLWHPLWSQCPFWSWILNFGLSILAPISKFV